MTQFISRILPFMIAASFLLGFVAPAALSPHMVPTVEAAEAKGGKAGKALNQYLGKAAEPAYGKANQNNLPVFIGNIIKIVLGVVGMVFLIITVYAGIMYMTAAGDEGKVKKAKAMLGQSIVGLIIIIGAYALTGFIVDRLAEATVATQPNK